MHGGGGSRERAKQKRLQSNRIMAEYWLVSAPGEPRPEDTWTLIKDKTSSHCMNYKFTIPSELKVTDLAV